MLDGIKRRTFSYGRETKTLMAGGENKRDRPAGRSFDLGEGVVSRGVPVILKTKGAVRWRCGVISIR